MQNHLTNAAQFLAMDSSYEEANVIVFGAPFDGTTSYRPGTRFAASQMRLESDGIETYSPRLDLDLEEFLICDAGDVSLSNGNTVKILSEINEVASQIIQDDKKPLMIGGEHLVTLPVIEALIKKHPDVHLLHFDAHTDLRDTYHHEKLSHATVIRRCWDLLGDHRIYQFGIRSGMKQEFDFALKEQHTYMEPFTVHSVKDIVAQLAGKKVYITIDLDILDPSIFPGTGTPEPGGITYKELETVFEVIKESTIEVVGADLVELSPHYDQTNVSTIVACKVLRELALLVAVK
ncbi:agmatinase [Turicibacter sp. TJ11]|uniref:agmatinase n=1 Tax=Turicibacter sp. TJ11 TaxID=2806443 RepID=UPI001F42F30B|nr:agmatinase [Turicibacter sp. TJ11]